jgi:hypothetical protein
MHGGILKYSRFAARWLWILPQQLLAAGGKAEPIVFVADSRRYQGWQAWFTNLYNDSLLYFAVLTVLTIPVVGVILGLLADLVMARIGINLKSRAVAEH